VRTFLLPLVVGACLPAAELVVRDVRAGLATRPLGFDFTLATPTIEASGSDAFAGGIGLEAGGRWSFARPGDAVGAIVGADLLIDGYTYEGGGSLAATALRAAAGGGWAVADRWTATLEAGWLYGPSTLTLPETASAPALEATGTMSGWDVRLGLDAMLTRRIGLGLSLSWLSLSHDLSGDDVTMTLDQAGYAVGVELRWRFTDAPPRLE
jgi:hypothetical protein